MQRSPEPKTGSYLLAVIFDSTHPKPYPHWINARFPANVSTIMQIARDALSGNGAGVILVRPDLPLRPDTAGNYRSVISGRFYFACHQDQVLAIG
jgi:hypothetical protein